LQITKKKLTEVIENEIRNYLNESTDPLWGKAANLGLGDASYEPSKQSLTGMAVGASRLGAITDDAVIFTMAKIWKTIRNLPPRAVEPAAKAVAKSLAARLGGGALAALGAFGAAPVLIVWAAADLVAHALDEWTVIGSREKKYRPANEVKHIAGARNLLKQVREIKTGPKVKIADLIVSQHLIALITTKVFAKFTDKQGNFNLTQADDRRDTDRSSGRLAVGKDLFFYLKSLQLETEKTRRKLCADPRVIKAIEQGNPDICSF